MPDRTLQRFAKAIVGTTVDYLRPGLLEQADPQGEAGRGGAVRLKSWVLQSRLERAAWRGDAAEIERLQHSLWQAEGKDPYFDRNANRFEKWFLGLHHRIVEALEAETATGDYRRLVEVGCGDGRVLEHLSDSLDSVTEFVGIDINPAIIERNAATYARNLRLAFVHGNARDVLQECLQDRTVLFTYGGVMEYFAEDRLSAMFGLLGRRQNTAVALVEPVDPAHDLAVDRRSHIFGREHSFSHNHRHLLRQAGYHVSFEHEIFQGGVRWVLILARKD